MVRTSHQWKSLLQRRTVGVVGGRQMARRWMMIVAGSMWLPLTLLAVLTLSSLATAQPPVHYQHRADMPPGAIGRRQLERGGPLAGYFQPVEIRAPEGALVSLAVEGNFAPPQNNTALAGMLIGGAYRVKVGNIRDLVGVDIFPSIEVIDRLYPPPGQETRFPIPIDITKEDLVLAAEGKYVTRVIYLEDPRNALPVRELDKEQRVLDSMRIEDPLKVADQLGRPMAILRLGSRTPDFDQASGKFLFDSPPLMLFGETKHELARNTGLEKSHEGTVLTGRVPRGFPRVPQIDLQRR